MAIVNQVVICGGTGCMSGNSEVIRDAFLKELQELGIQDEVQVFMSGCFGLCEKGPVVVVFPDMTFYAHMTEKDVKEICEEHLLKGRIVARKAYAEVNEQKVKEILAEQLGVDVSKVTLQTNVATDLGADSLDLVEILMSLEDEFGVSIPDEEIAGIKTVKQIVDFINANKK